MGTAYRMSKRGWLVRESVEQGHVRGLSIAHAEPDSPAASLWPIALTDGFNYAWLEGDMLLVWGSNKIAPIALALERVGVTLAYLG